MRPKSKIIYVGISVLLFLYVKVPPQWELKPILLLFLLPMNGLKLQRVKDFLMINIIPLLCAAPWIQGPNFGILGSLLYVCGNV